MHNGPLVFLGTKGNSDTTLLPHSATVFLQNPAPSPPVQPLPVRPELLLPLKLFEFSACSSDIADDLLRVVNLPSPETPGLCDPTREPQPCGGFLQRENFSTEIIESISPEDLQPTVNMCIDYLNSTSDAIKVEPSVLQFKSVGQKV